jgi:hypothetical protein
MTRRASDDRVADALALLDGSRVEERVGDTFILNTTTADGWPHIALLSVGEVLSVGDREIRIALWPNTAATRNITENGKALLAIIGAHRCLYLRLACRRGEDIPSGSGRLAFFAGQIEQAVEDEVGYAMITGGVTFDVTGDEVVERWRRTIASLREATLR